ncbi:MAG: hypothetical protein ACREIC_17415 [Limisphaerales bacterium]
MHTPASLDAEFEVSTHNPSNLVVVENQGETVLIRAAQNNFSQRRKAFLIRQLAAEGYIADRYQGFSEQAPISGLTWVIDKSLLVLRPAATRRTRRVVVRLIAGGCVALVLELIVLFLTANY